MRTWWRRQHARIGWAVLMLAVVAPLVIPDPFVHRLLASIALEAVLAVSLNLVLGYAGLISLGHVAFYGLGAYTAALLALRLGLPFPATLVLAAAAAGLAGWLLARPILHLRGHYFAMATLAFGEIVWLVAYNWDDVTRGASGLPGIPRPDFFIWTATSQRDNYYIALALLVLAVLAVRQVVHSPLGLSVMAARDDELAALSVGIEVARVRTTAFALAAAIAGAAGAFYAHYITFVSVEPFRLMHTITLLAMVAVGGMATLAGPVLGAILLGLLPEVLRGLADLRMVLYGALLILVIWLRPQGLLGGQHLFRRPREARSAGGRAVPAPGDQPDRGHRVEADSGRSTR